jgi:hypothetical protein
MQFDREVVLPVSMCRQGIALANIDIRLGTVFTSLVKVTECRDLVIMKKGIVRVCHLAHLAHPLFLHVDDWRGSRYSS